jgi:hypothetical protein
MKRDATLRSTCKPLASFERWFVFHFIGSPSENETSDQEFGPPMPTSFSSDSGCQPGIVYKAHKKGTPPGFLSKRYDPHKGLSDFLSDMKCWCEARTPTPTMIDGALLHEQVSSYRLLIRKTHEWQRKWHTDLLARWRSRHDWHCWKTSNYPVPFITFGTQTRMQPAETFSETQSCSRLTTYQSSSLVTPCLSRQGTEGIFNDF